MSANGNARWQPGLDTVKVNDSVAIVTPTLDRVKAALSIPRMCLDRLLWQWGYIFEEKRRTYESSRKRWYQAGCRVGLRLIRIVGGGR